MDLVIITGTPGTGKTIVAQKICEISNSHVISLGEMAITENFILSYDDERKTSVIDEQRVTEKIVNIINENKKVDYDLIIIESHFSDIVPNELIDYAVILRCHPEELKVRLGERGYTSEKVLENVQSEILGNCMNYLIEKQLKAPLIEIDTTGIKAENVAEIIVELIQNNEKIVKYTNSRIDWLEVLFRENRLSDFFDLTP